MKKLFLGAAMLAIALSSPAETKQALTLHMASGASIVYYLDTEPSISFKGQAMVVTVDHESTDIPMKDVARWEIGMAEYTGVEAPNTAAVSIRVYGNTLTIDNPDASHYTLYNMSGQVVGTGCQAEASFTLASGIYIVSIADHTYKIAIK